ncbi:hypothetical protein LY78DRAFT_88741 [Colletotrichum sublineola]|nr:hypothetical protein LY78DRAFT_88741 [Colletotrichum sublineola]
MDTAARHAESRINDQFSGKLRPIRVVFLTRPAASVPRREAKGFCTSDVRIPRLVSQTRWRVEEKQQVTALRSFAKPLFQNVWNALQHTSQVGCVASIQHYMMPRSRDQKMHRQCPSRTGYSLANEETMTSSNHEYPMFKNLASCIGCKLVTTVETPGFLAQSKIGCYVEIRLQCRDTGHGAVYEVVYGSFSSLVFVGG